MRLTRRRFFALSTGTAVLAFGGLNSIPAFASVDETQKMLSSFTSGKQPQTGKIVLTAPEIAENGNTVPVTVAVESPMSSRGYFMCFLRISMILVATSSISLSHPQVLCGYRC